MAMTGAQSNGEDSWSDSLEDGAAGSSAPAPGTLTRSKLYPRLAAVEDPSDYSETSIALYGHGNSSKAEPESLPSSSPPPRGLTKSYGRLQLYYPPEPKPSLKDKIRNAMAFIKSTVKNEKAERLKGKGLDKVAVAKMRKRVDDYDEMLGALEEEADGPREDDEEEAAARNKLQITSLRRELASMRKRS